MKIKQLLIILLFVVSSNLTAQTNKKTKDIEAIKAMCGCYEVSFNFAETFSYATDSLYQPSPVKHSSGLEWVELVEDSDNKLVLQHLLIVRDTMIIKHWRQDWLYENQDLYSYSANNQWTYQQYPTEQVVGQWTQKVYQVDDSPRYEGTATWVHVDGKSFWENKTDAPLPRREYTKRNDYNVTIRGNRHEITEEGWKHVQNNNKVVRESGKEDIIIADEVGLNTYKRVENDRCKVAQDWWKENKHKWKLVRKKWDAIFDQKMDISLHLRVNDKRLYEYLFDESLNNRTGHIDDIIESFIK